MFYLPLDRKNLLHFLPPEREVAEIGVAEGDFSQQIRDIARPRRLHLVDPWVHQDGAEYEADLNNVPSGEQDARHLAVQARFSGGIEAGSVVLHRTFSVEAAKTFADGSLDWVYIDAMHTYQAVKADLEAYAAKIKESGFILGHDYTNHPFYLRMGFGVVEAVNDFVVKSGWYFLALTSEIPPTFVLTKDPAHQDPQVLLANLIAKLDGILEIKNFPERGFEHRTFNFPGVDERVVPSF